MLRIAAPAELVLLVVFALANALHIRLVQRVNLARVLLALGQHPAVAVSYTHLDVYKRQGYTDNTGDPAMNLQLSADRAASVKQSLIAMGINDSRLESEGYGEQYPVASNDTEEGRAKNRRTSVRVTKK